MPNYLDLLRKWQLFILTIEKFLLLLWCHFHESFDDVFFCGCLHILLLNNTNSIPNLVRPHWPHSFLAEVAEMDVRY